MQALALNEADVCNELGLYPCITRPAAERPFRAERTLPQRVPHLVSLGGAEPFDTQLYESATSPSATSAVATDRVVLAACDARVEKDKAGPAVVLAGVDLPSASISDADATTIANLWFSRFHLRDATAEERAAVAALATDENGATISTADFALASCLAVGGMSESLFD
jgi:hypothetical protein